MLTQNILQDAQPHKVRAQGSKKSKKSKKQKETNSRPIAPNANRDKWVDVQSSLVPPAVPVWVRAMANTDKSPTRIRTDVPHLERGYAYPDPNSLAGLSFEQQARKLCTWLSLRPAIYSKAYVDAGKRPPTANGAAWRCVLTLDSSTVLPLEPWGTAVVDRETKAAKVKRAVQELFGAEIAASLQGPAATVYWHEAALQCQQDAIVDLDRNIVKQIIWELFEHNFRFELYSLDLAAAPAKHAEVEHAVARKEDIKNIWSGQKLVIWDDPFPRYNSDFQGETLHNRTHALDHLRRLMESWPNPPSAIVNRSFYGAARSVESDEDLEYQIVLFYCQTFFDFFGRPPIVPHLIPPDMPPVIFKFHSR